MAQQPCPQCGHDAKLLSYGDVRKLKCSNGCGVIDLCSTSASATFNGAAAPSPDGLSASVSTDHLSSSAESAPAPVIQHSNGNGFTNGHYQPVAERRVAGDYLSRVPPQNLEAEQSVLGTILIVNETIEEVQRTLKLTDFYREAHRDLYQAMLALWHTQAPIDVITLKAELERRKAESFKLIGGAAYLAELAAVVPQTANIAHYAKIVADCAVKREVASKAVRLASLAYDGVSVDALLGEAERLLQPALADSANHLPQLIDRDIEILSGREFFDRFETRGERNWIVDGFLARKEVSLWSGKVEHGKTTLMRTLVMCIARGEFFLDRHTYPGKVLYVMLDADGEDLTAQEFKLLGFDKERDDVDFLVDPVMALRPNSFEQFYAKLMEIKPAFVLIDPLGRFQRINDFLGYETTYAMAQFSELAKRANCHIALLHHIPRGRGDTDDPATAGFGSIAIAGGCNARFVCGKKTGGIYTLQTSRGKGGGFRPFDTEQVLNLDPDTHWVTLRGNYDWKEQARAIEPAVLAAVNASEESLSTLELARLIGVQRSIAGAAAKSLARAGAITLVVGKGNKHIFSRAEGQGSLLQN